MAHACPFAAALAYVTVNFAVRLRPCGSNCKLDSQADGVMFTIALPHDERNDLGRDFVLLRVHHSGTPPPRRPNESTSVIDLWHDWMLVQQVDC